MGQIIDLEKKDDIYRCNYVKLSIIWINLIGPPISLLFLLVSIIRMIIIKKRKAFLTYLILIIFFSEIIQCLSKMIQILKYDFPDTRDNKGISDLDIPRGIICQIQFTIAIFSDCCSLLSILLLSLRCYEVIHKKKGFFDEGRNGIYSILLIIFLSLLISIGFLFFDRYITDGNISYRYDLRDRCSYWCWLEHIPSLFCLGVYCIILFVNIYFACKTNYYLKMGYNQIIEQNKYTPGNENDMNTSLNEEENCENPEKKENSDKNENQEKKMYIFTPEEKKRIQKLQLMRTKCLIYPSVTIAYWLFAATYRIVDDAFMIKFDSRDGKPDELAEEERNFFREHNIFQIVVQIFLVAYTILSSIRGILYGFSFIVFEEKIFFNFFKKIWIKYLRDDNLKLDEEEEKNMIRNTYNSSSIGEYNLKEEQKDDNYSNIEMNRNSNTNTNTNYDNETT